MKLLDKLDLKSKLIVGFSVPLALFVIIAFTVFFSLTNLIKTSGWVNHTYEAIDLGNSITASLVNMETGLRGFLVAGKDEFLEPYHAGKSDFKTLIEKTKLKISDNAKQVARLEEVEQMETDWLNKHVDVAIAYRREVRAGAEAADKFKRVSARTVGKENFDGFRASLGQVESTLERLNDRRGLELVKLILISMINQETGQRGFLLTGKEESLEPYHSGRQAFDEHSAQLRTHLINNGRRQTLGQLESAVKKANGWRLKAALPEISARREMNNVTRTIDDVTAFIERGIGKQYMDGMREILQQFVDEESKLIIIRNDSQESTATVTKVITIFGALAALIIGGVISLFLTRNVLQQLGSDPKELEAIAEQIANGNLNVKVDTQNSTGVKQSMGRMRENLAARQESDIAIQNEIDDLVTAATKGDFSKSINLEGKQGVFLEMSKGLNQLLTTCDLGLNDVIRVLQAIAKGDLSQTITQDYQGAFNELKNYSNNTVAQLKDVMGEISDTVHSASEGDFSSKIDLAGKTGFFKDLSENLNELMSTTNDGLTDTLRILEALAKGDLSQSIDKEYKGDFDKLKQYANNTVNQINLVMGEIGELVNSANQGDFTTQIELARKTGFFKDLSENLNTLMSTTENGLNDVLNILGALANGDLSQSIDAEYQGSFDTLKRYSNNTVNQMKEVMGSIGELVDAANQGDFKTSLEMEGKKGFFKDLSNNLNELMKTTDNGLEDVMSMLSALAEGDLSVRIDKEYQGSFAKLKSDANTTAEKLTEVIENIKISSTSVEASTQEISRGNADLSTRTESQASSLEETASSMEEMTSAISQSEDRATNASKLSQNASDKANEGGAVVDLAVNAMDEINTSSKKIADIIGVIDEIAFQTNLLALNAAVEAARAGEQGRGFAVVAGEVRNLAQRSASAAKEIKDLIQDSVGKVEGGTVLVNKSGQTLKEIVTAVQEVSDMIKDISSTSREQTSGIQQVNSAVAQMDEMTQQNAALVEESSAAFESMAGDIGKMIEVVGFFNTKSKY